MNEFTKQPSRERIRSFKDNKKPQKEIGYR